MNREVINLNKDDVHYEALKAHTNTLRTMMLTWTNFFSHSVYNSCPA